jgi:RND family efflux transporter MFP subunit
MKRLGFRSVIVAGVLAFVVLTGYGLRGYLPRDHSSVVTLAKNAKAWFLAEKVESAQAGNDEKNTAAHTEHADGNRKIAYWYDAMNPSFKSDQPGTAPDGMKLVPMYEDQLAAMSSMPAGTVMLSADKQQLIGVRTAVVEVADLSRTIRTVGRIESDETRIARIHTKFQGWIDKVYIDFVGKLVQKGDPLFTVYSPELLATQQEYLIARKARVALSSGINREIGVDPDALVQSALQRLRLWDISEDQLARLEQTGETSRTLLFVSPIDGYVTTKEVFENTFVTPDKELYTIVDLSKVWVNVDIYEYEAPYIRLGQQAQMTLSYNSGKTYEGTVSYLYPTLDPNTRTLKVRLEFPNPSLALKPNMFADVELRIGAGRTLQVPAEAVLDSGVRKIVFISKPGGYFEPREIQVGSKMDGKFVVTSGLKPGETIVTSGNFLIDSESKLSSSAAPAHAHGEGK